MNASPAPIRVAPRLRRSVEAVLLALSALPAAAQEAPVEQRLNRVEITGSAIKRLESETALPVQVISREEINKAGVTTAAELLSKVAANVGALTDGVSINVGGDQRGFNSANLRGLGTSSTLVLLNGRRMANFASPGDDAGVDLHNIPAAAVQRVEVLMDGASALYGTDAIGGVINFITRKDFEGLELNAHGGWTQEGGAGKRTLSLAGGVGDIARDGFNVFAVLDAQQTGRLSTSQRKFIPELQVPQRLGHLLSGFTSPANIRLTSAQRDHLQETGFLLNGKPITNRTINFSQPNCAPPANLYLPDGTGGKDACTYDYMGDTELYPKSQNLSLLTRGVLQLAPDHQFYAELSLARSRTDYVGSSARVTGYIDYRKVPQLANTDLDQLDDDTPGELELRMRLNEAGRRTSELTSTGQRLVLGLTGTLSGWDYDVGLNHSINTVSDRDTHGYLLYDKLMQGIADGIINPFGPSSAQGKALIDSIQVNDEVRHARGTMSSVDFKASRPVAQLAGGEAMLAIGGELRHERTDFTPSALLMSDNINNDGAPEGGHATSDSRRVAAVFGELSLPFAPNWELQLSARHDRYQEVGGATSPKLGLRYQPDKHWLMRASAGTGFRAPSLNDLHRPTVYSSTATLADPVYCAANDNDLSICADNWDTRRYSNPKLKPERSQQFSFGGVWEPSRSLTTSLDYWNIRRTRLISEIGDDIILSNLSKYGDLVHRYTPDSTACTYRESRDNQICYIDLRKENRGAQKASGLDFSLDLHGLKTEWGALGARVNGTLVLESKLQNAPGDAFVSNLGRFVTKGAVQRWRHRLTLDWERGPVGLSLANSYSSGYEDQNTAINTDNGTIVSANRVKAYSTWDLSGWWDVSRQLKLRAGIQNLGNTSPPFSNQAYYFISGYDPSYTDPRGRFFYLSAQYRFR